MTTAKVGVTTWDEKNQVGLRERNNGPRFSFYKMKQGPNKFRIVTDPYTYYVVKFQGEGMKFPRKVATAWPVHETECPAVNVAKLKPKKRYYVGVIDRDDDNQLKILDMGLSIYDDLQKKVANRQEEWDEENHESDRKITPKDFDIIVTFDKFSTTPAGFYSVDCRGLSSLREADVELLNENADAIAENLERLSFCPKPETVRSKLEALGWNGEEVKTLLADDEEHEEVQKDDLNFDRPPSATLEA